MVNGDVGEDARAIRRRRERRGDVGGFCVWMGCCDVRMCFGFCEVFGRCVGMCVWERWI